MNKEWITASKKKSGETINQYTPRKTNSRTKQAS
jgi:hypothetical protein